MNSPLCVLHITDSHLFSDPNTEKNGLNPQDTLQRVLSSALQEHNADAVIHTGDTAHEAIDSTYQNFLSTVREQSNAPLLCSPGNHDLSEPFTTICPTDDLVLGDWFITGVDSHTDRIVSGHLTNSDLQDLKEKISQRNSFTLVATHHPPQPIGVSWLDDHRIDNGSELLDLCAEYKGVRGVICGHVHQAYEESHGSFDVMTTPSTCWQFGEDTVTFQLSDRSPGWRWVFLHDGGEITTQVGRLTN